MKPPAAGEVGTSDQAAAIDRWIAENGVTKCPPAAVAPTEARIPSDAAAELAEHHEQLGQQRIAPMRTNISASVREAQSKRRQAEAEKREAKKREQDERKRAELQRQRQAAERDKEARRLAAVAERRRAKRERSGRQRTEKRAARQQVAAFDPGPRPRMAWLPIDELVVDTAYQRPLAAAHARALAAEFRWAHFQPLTVAARPDGGYAVIDGQHRLQAARALPAIAEVPCYIVDAADSARQASTFLAVNTTHRAVKAIEKFRAGLAAGDKQITSLQRIVDQVGLRLVSGKATAPMQTASISTLLRTHRIAGPEPLRKALSAIATAWPAEREAFGEQFIRAVTLVFQEGGAALNPWTVIEQLRQISPTTFLAEQIMAGKEVRKTGQAMITAELFRRCLGREFSR